MAQFVMQYLVNNASLSEHFFIDSAATSREAIGMPPDLRTVRKLKKEGIESLKHRAKQITLDDYNDFDYLIIMDDRNKLNLERIIGSDTDGKVYKLLEFAPEYSKANGNKTNIADPWYTGNFDEAFTDIMAGCTGFLKFLTDKNKL